MQHSAVFVVLFSYLVKASDVLTKEEQLQIRALGEGSSAAMIQKKLWI